LYLRAHTQGSLTAPKCFFDRRFQHHLTPRQETPTRETGKRNAGAAKPLMRNPRSSQRASWQLQGGNQRSVVITVWDSSLVYMGLCETVFIEEILPTFGGRSLADGLPPPTLRFAFPASRYIWQVRWTRALRLPHTNATISEGLPSSIDTRYVISFGRRASPAPRRRQRSRRRAAARTTRWDGFVAVHAAEVSRTNFCSALQVYQYADTSLK
jgi:hypothetical protein